MSRRTRPPPWHSRRWEANLSQLHSKYARSDTENLTELTYVPDAALRDELLARGVPQTEVDALIRRHLTPQLRQCVTAYFCATLRAADSTRSVQQIPPEVLYSDVHLRLPPEVYTPGGAAAVRAAAVGADDLQPVARASKLGKTERPREACDPRRGRRLHLCECCYSYKMPTEFYACCLQDATRFCRECMLQRPREPFGEHLDEEERTAPNLRLADALLACLSRQLLHGPKTRGGGGAGVGAKACVECDAPADDAGGEVDGAAVAAAVAMAAAQRSGPRPRKSRRRRRLRPSHRRRRARWRRR